VQIGVYSWLTFFVFISSGKAGFVHNIILSITMKKIVVIFLSFVFIAITVLGKVNNGEKKFCIFDPSDIGKSTVVENRTSHWVKGSNFKPKTTVVAIKDKKWLGVKYFGDKGYAQTTFYFNDKDRDQLNKDIKNLAGFEFEMFYRGTGFSKILIKISLKNGMKIVKEITLKKGAHTYSFVHGWRPHKERENRFEWSKISMITFMNKTTTQSSKKIVRELAIGKVWAVSGENQKGKKRVLQIESRKKVFEVLPSSLNMFDASSAQWASVNSLNLKYISKNNLKLTPPVKVQITYDKDNLYIKSESEYPTAPKSTITKKDSDVYQDEAIELFFSAENDNDKKMQFVSNFAGTVFDYIREYDLVACSVRTLIEKDISHKKRFSFKHGKWIANFAFSFKEIKLDLSKCPFMGFQYAQDYVKRDGKYKTCVWVHAKRLPVPLSFGTLIFNKTPFGSGNIVIDNNLEKIEQGAIIADFNFSLEFKNIEKGEYTLQKIIIAADNTITKLEEPITIDEDLLKKNITINNCPNKSGMYTVYFSLINKAGNSLLSGANFDNVRKLSTLFGEIVLNPIPKEIEWTDGYFSAVKSENLFIGKNPTKRTIKTAQLFADRFYGYTGRKLTVKNESSSGENDISFSIQNSIKYKNKNYAKKTEGYLLNVNDKGISITGFDEAGLFYGGITLLQLMKSEMKIDDKHLVKCCNIIDWPDYYNRCLMLHHPWGFRNRKFKDIRSIDWLIEWLEKVMVEQKENLLYIDLSALTRYEKRTEFNGSEKIYSINDLKKLGQFCRDNFIETCATWQIGGHANWWLLGYHPELREKGWKFQADITHPDHDKIVYDCFEEITTALQSKYISPKDDEWWHKIKVDEKIEPTLHNGMKRNEAFLQWHIKLNEWAKKRGMQMMIYEDMLTPHGNGTRFDLYKIIDKFPKDIIINSWRNKGPEYVQYFLDKGFEVWLAPTGWFTYKKEVAKQMKGFAKTTYMLGAGWSLYDKMRHVQYIYGPYQAGDYGWNAFKGDRSTVEDNIESGRLVAVRNIAAVRPNPSASDKLVAIDLTGKFNANAGDVLKSIKKDMYKNTNSPLNLKTGKHKIGNIETIIGDSDENCILIQKDGVDTVVPVSNEKFASLIFLHTSLIDIWVSCWKLFC
jgi:Glycosyl hydrolase family 20, domain 2/Glycosyl hydrolase family 20, catalytic domain